MKKFLSLALALVMVLGLVPAFAPQAEAAADTIATSQVYKTDIAPIINGELADDEWGPIVKSMDGYGAKFNDVSQQDLYMLWDDNYLYIAMQLFTTKFYYASSATDPTSGTHARVGASKLEANKWNIFGSIGIMEDGTVALDGTYLTNTGCSVAAKFDSASGIATYEIRLQKDWLLAQGVLGVTTWGSGSFYGNFGFRNPLSDKNEYINNENALAQGSYAFAFNSNANQNVVRVVKPTSGTITLNGDLSEWGDADFVVNEALTKRGRNYFLDDYGATAAGSHIIPNTPAFGGFYWRYDAQNLYLAVEFDYGGADTQNAVSGYEGWDYTQALAYNTYKTDRAYTGRGNTYIDVTMGSKTFRITNPVKTGSVVNGDGYSYACTDNGGTAVLEVAIPLSNVLGTAIQGGKAFIGFIHWHDEFDWKMTSADTKILENATAVSHGWKSDGGAGAIRTGRSTSRLAHTPFYGSKNSSNAYNGPRYNTFYLFSNAETAPVNGTDFTFEATSDSTGILTFKTPGNYKYSVYRNTATPITATTNGPASGAAAVTVELTGLQVTSSAAGMLHDCLNVYRLGDGVVTYNSHPTKVVLTQAAAPTGLTAVAIADAADLTGEISGIDAAKAYQFSTDGTTWTDAVTSGTQIINLAPGTYYVREKANGSVLASAASAAVTIGKYTNQMAAVSLTADGYASGTLTTTDTGLSYKMGDAEWKAVDASLKITDLVPGVLQLKKFGNGTTTLDSDAVSITVTRQEKPALVASQPAEVGGKGSIPTTEAHEYSTDGVTYTACTGALENLNPGTYYVRAKASGTALTSEAQQIVIDEFIAGQVPTPSLTFTADGYNSGLVDTEDAAIRYKMSDETEWKSLTATQTAGYSAVTGLKEGILQIKKLGNGTTTADSNVQSIEITRPAVPALTPVQPNVIGGKGSIPTTEAHEYSTDGETYTACTGALENLNPGTYYVRVKAAGTALTSDVQTIVITEFNPNKEATPAVTFTATGYDTGVINTTDAKIVYKMSDETEWKNWTGEGVLTGLKAGTLQLKKLGNGTTTVDSDVQEIAIFRAMTPDNLSAQLKVGDANTTVLHGVSSVMEYKLAEEWTAIAADKTELAGVKLGDTVQVRVFASGDTLASATVTLTVVKADAPAEPQTETTAPVFEGATNGKITGLNPAEKYEYKAAAATEWIAVAEGTAEIINLPAGAYMIRLAETETRLAGATATVTVGSGITVPISIELDATTAHKTAYAVGDALDVSGLKVLVRMNDGTTKVVDGTAVTVTGLNTTGIYVSQTLTVAYTENGVTQTLTYDVSVSEDVLSEEEQSYMNVVWAMYMMYNQKFSINAAATEGGTITPAGIAKVKYNESKTFTAKANDGYKLKSLIVDGVDMGAITEYTFTKVKAGHTITAVFEKTAPAAAYTDVKTTDWYYADVQKVTELGLMNGTGNKAFEPKAELTRAALVTTLWRLAGEPKANAADFTDVKTGEWYAAAVNWAAANNVVNGYDGKFDPDGAITREQVMAILHRFADLMKYDAKAGVKGDYTASDWAAADVAWANANGILTGIETDISDMTAEANRAEIAAYLARFAKAFVK